MKSRKGNIAIEEISNGLAKISQDVSALEEKSKIPFFMPPMMTMPPQTVKDSLSKKTAMTMPIGMQIQIGKISSSKMPFNTNQMGIIPSSLIPSSTRDFPLMLPGNSK